MGGPVPGQRISHFEVLDKIGQGGMGEVYRARDSRINREVALKTLPPDVSADPARRIRFEQEARLLATLNHPNIISIFDVGESYIVTELVAGESLRTVLAAEHRLSPRKVADISAQIAGGLAAAHARNIIHRDLKPENVMLTRAGQVKILDFGIAKQALGKSDSDDTHAVTKTTPGMLVGTITYMSPEQARAEHLGPSSDIFSLGIMMYEMLTGRHPFAGPTDAETLSAILRSDPPDLVSERVPPGLASIVMRCLEKEPAGRFQSAADLAFSLRSLAAAGTGPIERKKRRFLVPLVIAAAMVVCTIAFLAYRLWASNGTPATDWTFRRLTFDGGLTTHVTASSDGKFIAYSSDRAEGNFDIWVQQLNGGSAIRLTTNPGIDYAPSFSPDGTNVAFTSSRDHGEGIYIVPALGGDERLLAKAGRMPAFSPQGSLIAYSVGHVLGASEIRIIPSTGGKSTTVHTGLRWATAPRWSPDGKSILFAGSTAATGSDPRTVDWYIVPATGGSAQKTGLSENLRSVRYVTVPEDRVANFNWSSSGLLIAAAAGDGGALLTADADHLTAGTQPLKQLFALPGVYLGTPLFVNGQYIFGGVESNLDIWSINLDPDSGAGSGEPQRVTQDVAADVSPSVSSDGGKLVFTSNRNGNMDVWLRDVRVKKDITVVRNPTQQWRAKTSRDGKLVAFQEREQNIDSVQMVEANGTSEEKLCDGCSLLDWSPDGRKVLFWHGQPIRFSAIDVITKRVSVVLSHPKYSVTWGQYSPNGEWLLFQTPLMDGKRSPIFVTRLVNGSAGAQSDWIEVQSGSYTNDTPTWSSDGRVVYFISDRDGSRCFWGQRVDSADLHPVGDPFAVLHLHGGRRWLASTAAVGPAVTRGRMFFALHEYTGNIWLAEPR